MNDTKRILLIDFDGVLHSYESGWKGARVIPDPPVPGAMKFLDEALEYFDVHIYSSRSRQWGGKRAMKKWLLRELEKYVSEKYKEEGFGTMGDPWNPIYVYERFAWDILSKIKFPTKKPAAFLTIDDRCLCFRGIFPFPKVLQKFKPWNRKDV